MNHIEAIRAIENKISADPRSAYSFQLSSEQTRSEFLKRVLDDELKSAQLDIRNRIRDEFEAAGPLETLFADEEITEIIVNGFNNIWFEKGGQLFSFEDQFASQVSYQNFISRMLSQAQVVVSKENPIAQSVYRNFRLHYIDSELTRSEGHICFRRHPESPWTLDKLMDNNFVSPAQVTILKNIINKHKNFLVIGGTGSGKTSLLNAILNELPKNERCVIIEDTPELKLPNRVSAKLLTKENSFDQKIVFDQSMLVKNALRMRPDRIIMGEIRAQEAKDFLMALSTGHLGSFGSLHAASPSQALIRLEMLIQWGASQWGLVAIRRLIQMSLDYIISVQRTESGERKLAGIYKICSLEETGFIVESVLP